jgi:hypothetical protein
MSQVSPRFDSKIAIVIHSDLPAWQKLNVAAFLAGGIAAAFPSCIGEAYQDAFGTHCHALIGQPILIYAADRSALALALERAASKPPFIPRRCSQQPTMPPIGPSSRPRRGLNSSWLDWRFEPTVKSSTRLSMD